MVSLRPTRSFRLVVMGGLAILTLALLFRVIPAVEWVYPSRGEGEAGSPTVRVTVVGAVDEDPDPVGPRNDAPEEIRLFGVDSWYHLRHTRLAAENFPHLQRHDLWVNFPAGYRAPEIGLYALGMAGAAWILDAGSPSEERIRKVVAWTPTVLAGATYLTMLLLAGNLWGSMAGLLAAALLLAYPGSFLTQGIFGLSDHHVAEALLLLLVMLGLSHLVHTAGQKRGESREWGMALLAALPLCLFHFTWNGAPVYLLFTGIALFATGCLALALGSSPGVARAILRYGVCFTLLTGGIGFLAPELVQFPDLFPLVLVAGSAIALILPAVLGPIALRLLRTGRNQAAIALGIFCAGLATLAAGFLFTGPGRGLWRVLTERRTATVSEHDLALDSNAFLHHASLPGIVALLAPLVFGWILAKGGAKRVEIAWVPPLILALLAPAVWAATGDFGYVVAPCAALLATFVLTQGIAPVLKRIGRNEVRVAAGAGGILLLLLPPFLGVAGAARPWPAQSYLSELMIYNDGWAEALEWMEVNTPPSIPGNEPGENGSPSPYGVLASWDFGNFVTAVAKRPVLWSQGPDDGTIGWFLARSEAAAEERLAALEGEYRFIIADARTAGDFFVAKAQGMGIPEDDLNHPAGEIDVNGRLVSLATFGAPFDESMVHRLYYGNGSELERYRLIFASAHRTLTGYVAIPGEGGTALGRVARSLDTEEERVEASRYVEGGHRVIDFGAEGVLFLPHVEPTVKIFERVTGAYLTGRAPVGATVMAVLVLTTGEGGGLLDYRRTVTAGADGRYSIRVPYSVGDQEWASEGVYADAPYRILQILESGPIAADGSSTALVRLLAEGVVVTEEDVTEGREVPVP